MLSFLIPYLKYFKIILVALFCAGLFFSGMKVEGWRKDEVISEMRLQQATDRGNVLEKALKDLADASARMSETAKAAQKTTRISDEKLDAIAKEIKTFKPLPVDCRPDVDRVRNFNSAIDAANSTIP
jgi:gamma-glutamyl phosphate reductase